jgi:hypothetical protein
MITLSSFHCYCFTCRTENIETAVAKRWPPLIGHMFITSPVLQVQPEKNGTKFTDYLICPPYFFNKTNYPTFTSGTGYIMPWWAVPCFYQVNMINLYQRFLFKGLVIYTNRGKVGRY